jgi:hypothetical protein
MQINPQVNPQLNEGLESGDLARLVHPELHIDEFKSKLGDDEDVIVLSFKVDSKEPAINLVSFIEKGYSWVVDADLSSGEMDDGSYIVYVEIDRNEEAPKNIIDLVEDILNLTDQKLSDWRVRYHKARKERELRTCTIHTRTVSATVWRAGSRSIENRSWSACGHQGSQKRLHRKPAKPCRHNPITL